jgi:hypothetical protein
VAKARDKSVSKIIKRGFAKADPFFIGLPGIERAENMNATKFEKIHHHWCGTIYGELLKGKLANGISVPNDFNRIQATGTTKINRGTL